MILWESLRPGFSREVVAPQPARFRALPEVLFETMEHDVQLVLATLMIPCFTQVSFCLFLVKERVLMHPAVHVGLGSACGYICPPFSTTLWPW